MSLWTPDKPARLPLRQAWIDPLALLVVIVAAFVVAILAIPAGMH